MTNPTSENPQRSILAMVADRARQRRDGIDVGGLSIPVMPAETARPAKFEDEKDTSGNMLPSRRNPRSEVVEDVDMGEPGKIPGDRVKPIPALPDEAQEVTPEERTVFLTQLEEEFNADAKAWDWAKRFLGEDKLNEWEDQNFAVDVRQFLLTYFSEGPGSRFNRDPYEVWSEKKLVRQTKYGETI